MQDTKLNTLMGYLARGWALVPLHDVSAGACSCRSGAQCSNPGKHPRWSEWQRDPQLVRDHVRLAELHASAPQWNWGVATGEPSRVFVLDWDVSHDLEIRAWLEANIEGDWQPHETPYLAPDLGTLTLGPTGGGGWHYVFALPLDFVPRGSQTRNRYGLPPGLDIRGAGGQIVVHPSVSSKGEYGATLLDRPVAQAPGWLLDMLRPQPVDNAVDNYAAGGAALGMHGVALAPASADRLHAYAIAAVRGALEELQTAPEGTRNDTAARTARRVLELIQSPWTGLDGQQVYDLWHMAGEVSGLPFGELDGVWRRAVAAMSGKTIDPPALADWGGEYVPFAPMAQPTGGMPPDPFMNPDGYSSTAAAVAPANAFEQQVLAEMGRLAVRDEARKRYDAAKLGNPDEQLAILRAALVDSAGLDDLPELEPLIDGMLWRNTFCRVIGESTHGKSFVLLDMAGCVGSGIPWAGRETRQGNVVYLVAEGATGIRARVRAWEKFHCRRMEGVRFLPIPVQATSAQWATFVRLAVELAPAFIIGDTQARLTVDVDENSAQDMGVVVAAMEDLRAATGACVTLVHHKGPRGDGRGSKSVRGALQTELDVSRKDQIVTVVTTKQKDAAEAEPIIFELAPVNIATDAWADEHTVPVPIWLADGAEGGRARYVEPADRVIGDDELTGVTARIAGVLAKLASEYGMTQAQIYSAVSTKGIETYVCTKSAASKAWNDHLLSKKIIGKVMGTQRWRYLPVDIRSQVTISVNGTDGKEGYYAP